MANERFTGEELFDKPNTPPTKKVVDKPVDPIPAPDPAPAPDPTPDPTPAPVPDPPTPAPAPAPDPTPPAFDFQTHFGEKYKSPDDIKNVLTQYEQLTQERDTLKLAVEQVQNPFANDTVYKLNALVKKGMDPKLAYRMANLTEENIAQKSAYEVIALLEMSEVPEMISMEADLNDEIQYRYDQTILKEEDGYTPEQVEESKRRAKRNQLLLAKDAAKAREKILQLSKVDPMEVKDPVAAAKEKQQVLEQTSRQWGEIAPRFVQEGLRELPIYHEVFNEETKKIETKELMKFKMSEDRLIGFDKELQQMAVANNIPLTPDGMKVLYSMAYATLRNRYDAAITSAVKSHLEGSAKKEAEQKFTQPDYQGRPGVQRPLEGSDNLTKDERIQKQGDKLFPERSGRR